jgi:hypothetical protein
MRSTVIKTSGDEYAVVGETIVLREPKDRRQIWFPFMSGAIFPLLPLPEQPEPYRKGRIPKDVYARVADKRNAPPDEIPPQMNLMFPEFKRVTRREFKLLKRKNFPFWERDANNQLLVVALKPECRGSTNEMREVIKAWCNDQLSRRYFFGSNEIFCQSGKDAVIVKLKFG